MSESASRNSGIDPMRLGLALCVVALHTGFPDGAGAAMHQVLINGLYRVAVPVFALISGYFFLGAMQAGRQSAYIGRILSLYALWMVIYLPIYGPEFTSVGHVMQTLFFGYFHLWFLPGLVIGAVLVMALQGLGRAPLAAAAIAAALTGLVLQWLTLTGRATLQLDFYRNGLMVIFPFFATGYLLAGAGAGSPQRMGWHWAAGALLAVIAESVLWYWIAGGGYGIDTMASLYLAAPVLFLAARGVQGGWNGKRIASMAAFVYFIHILMMIVASRFGLDGNAKALFVMAASLGLARWLAAERRRPVLAMFT